MMKVFKFIIDCLWETIWAIGQASLGIIILVFIICLALGPLFVGFILLIDYDNHWGTVLLIVWAIGAGAVIKIERRI